MPISENEAVIDTMVSDVTYFGIVRDEMMDLMRFISQSADHDVLILSGGVSVGTYDLVTEALEKCGARILGWIIPHTFLPGRMSTNWFI